MFINWLHLFFLSLSFAAEMPSKVHLQTQHWAPYQIEESGEVSGIAVKMIRCSFDKLKVQLEISVVPWSRAQLNTKEGRADGFFAASKNDQRDKYAVLSETHIEQNWVWYTLKGASKDIKSTDTHGAMKGSNMLQNLKAHGFNIEIESRVTEDLFKALLLKRVSRILVSELVALELEKSKTIDLSQFEKSLYQKNPLGIYFSSRLIKRYPQFLPAFNKNFKICSK